MGNVRLTKNRYSEKSLRTHSYAVELWSRVVAEPRIHRLRNLVTIIMCGIETNNVQTTLDAVRRLEQELLRSAEPTDAVNLSLFSEETLRH